MVEVISADIPLLVSSRTPHRIVQLLPRGAGGVLDYAECLSRQWEVQGLQTHLIGLSQLLATECPLANRLRALAMAAKQPLTLLLHYSGYGFHKRALCIWLLRELERARRELGSELRVVTMFHELYASGPPWTSVFWLSAIQEWVARGIARASDHVLTNTERHAAWLRPRLRSGVSVEVWPVFSSIGEPAATPAGSQRRPVMVVFGAEPTRRRALDRLPAYEDALVRAGVVEVVEVGSGSGCGLPVGRLKYRFAGRLETPELQGLLLRSSFGLIDYPPHLLAKSTVFAAYAAHGCAAVNTAIGPAADGLEGGQHFLAIEDLVSRPVSLEVLQRISGAARCWYADHTIEKQARVFSAACGADGPAVV